MMALLEPRYFGPHYVLSNGQLYAALQCEQHSPLE